MNVSSKLTWASLWGCAGLATLGMALAAAETTPADSNPYSVISDRNIFHLNPPPPPPPPEAAKPVDLPKVMLTGFVGKGSSEKVLLAIPPKDNKDSILYLSLRPGEKGGENGRDVELVRIRLKEEEVDILNSGTPQTLSVKSNSYASIAVAAPHPAGGAPAMPDVHGIRRQFPGFPPPNQPPPPAPAAAVTPSGGSAIIAGGGGGGDSGSSYGSPYGSLATSSGGAIVSGGAPYVPNIPNSAPATGANNVGAQIANSLFNSQTGRYQMPTPTAPAAPPEVQAAGMLLQQTALGGGGPPLPPSVQAALEGH